ncbi:hypothetical protein LguiA_020374 [Lonicera macranthoides]
MIKAIILSHGLLLLTYKFIRFLIHTPQVPHISGRTLCFIATNTIFDILLALSVLSASIDNHSPSLSIFCQCT